jgi:hypothetical protein
LAIDFGADAHGDVANGSHGCTPGVIVRREQVIMCKCKCR